MRLAKALIRLRVCAGWSECLLVADTTLLEISCDGSSSFVQVCRSSVGVCLENDQNEELSRDNHFQNAPTISQSTVYSGR